MGAQKVVVDWTNDRGRGCGERFGDRLPEAPRSFAVAPRSGAIEFAMGQLDKAPYEAARRTIDVSGDGTGNAGRDVAMLRDEGGGQRHHHQRAA